ncbi:MAG: hypothetical protein ABI767_05540 [Rhodanobacter sp.]
MSSIWTDLLFLHGHLVRKEDLAWHHEKCPEGDSSKTAVKADSSDAPLAASPERRKLRWPHLSAPR